ncbi:MAG: lipoyl(octanoyl) transferase LipB [Gemmatimonadales bacterium]|jgi:lipoate-protein ligase B|nr:lipoyl(octanoyl) transferase LipB [Gemmatimonadales bacterium]
MPRPLGVVELGRRPYGEVLELQRDLARRRADGALGDDVLLLVEHDPVVTLGRGTRRTSLPLDEAELRRRGVAVFEVERGGDVTWHGPGQLVGYPIVDLREHRPDLHWYLRTLEDGVIDGLEALGVPADRVPGRTGVWTAGRKIASIGVHARRWVTLHGFALNVVNDLAGFELIVPCGLEGVVMTSVAEELAAANPATLTDATRDAVVRALGAAFDRTPEPWPASRLGTAHER